MTTQLAPQTIYSNLLNEVAEFVLGKRATDEFSLRALKKKAEALAKANVAEGVEIQAYVAFLQGAHEAAVDLIERAISLSAIKAEVIVRYLQICNHVGLFDCVWDVYSKYSKLLDGTITETREVMHILVSNGYLIAAEELRANLMRMNASAGHVNYVAGERLVSQCDHAGFSDEDTSAVVLHVRSFLHRHGLKAQKIGVSAISGEGNGEAAMLYEIGVDVTPERAAEVEWDLFGELEEKKFPAEICGKFLFALTSCPEE